VTEAAAAIREERGSRWRHVGRKPDPVSFAELVWAHQMRQEALEAGRTYDGPEERRFRDFTARFEAHHGEIVNAYWCRHEASAVAVTVKRARPVLRILGQCDRVRLHRVTDWTTKDMPELARVMHRIETLAVKAADVLRDTPQRVTIQWLFSEASYLLGFADGAKKREARETAAVVRHEKEDLAEIDAYYRNAAVRSAHVVYLSGVLAGAAVLAAVGVLGWILWRAGFSSASVRTAVGAFAAGGIGALVSVMSRMTTGRLAVDYDIGRDTLRVFGALRPFIGAVFGLALYFALESNLLNLQVGESASDTFAFYVFLGFLAGFSERWAQDMLLGAGRSLLPTSEESEGPPARAAPGPAARPASRRE
jgi:hypothetical protein